MNTDYLVPASEITFDCEFKKSRFIGHGANISDRTSAMAFLQAIKQRYPDARHRCWAYRTGSPSAPTNAAYSDDGEPKGTAGKPILNVVNHSEIGDLMLVVVRYFGGAKLGAGGLVRAYSHCAQQVVDILPTRVQVCWHTCRVSGDYPMEQGLRHWLKSHGGEITDIQYHQRVDFHIKMKRENIAALTDFVLANGGRVLPS